MATEPDPDDVVAPSRRSIEASRNFIHAAQTHVDAAGRRIEHARNVLQAMWLKRELRRRGRVSKKREYHQSRSSADIVL
jgi:hypothetical protein